MHKISTCKQKSQEKPSKIGLKKIKKTRDWLADQLDLSARTVSNWITAGQTIAVKRQNKIAKLFAKSEDKPTPQSPQNAIISIPIPAELLRRLEFHALEQGITLSQLGNIILTYYMTSKNHP